MAFDGLHVGNGERLCCAGAGSDAVDVAAARFRPDEVVPKAAQLLPNLVGAALADRHRADHRSDADGDAEHRQAGAQFVSPQSAERDAEE